MSFNSPRAPIRGKVLEDGRMEYNSYFKLCFRSHSQDESSDVTKSHSRHVPGYGLQVRAKSKMAFI